ncbi:TPA: phage tail assembly protein [Pseudomonas aeruginosa]
MKEKTPEWLELRATGATVSLRSTAEVNGVKVDKLTLRAPTVRDILASEEQGAETEAQRELALFSTLAEVGRKDLEGLTMVDYRRLQTAYFRLVQDDGI